MSRITQHDIVQKPGDRWNGLDVAVNRGPNNRGPSNHDPIDSGSS